MKIVYNSCSTEIYESPTLEGILSDDCNFIAESIYGGTSHFNIIECDESEIDELEETFDINDDVEIDLKKFEGKYIKVIIFCNGRGEYDLGDQIIGKGKPYEVCHGLASSFEDIDGEEIELEELTQYDYPEISKEYYIVENGFAKKLYEENGVLYDEDGILHK